MCGSFGVEPSLSSCTASIESPTETSFIESNPFLSFLIVYRGGDVEPQLDVLNIQFYKTHPSNAVTIIVSIETN